MGKQKAGAIPLAERLDALEGAHRKLREELASERELGRALQARLTETTNAQEDKLFEMEERLENLQEEAKANTETTSHFRELLYGEDGVVYRNETRALDSRLEQVKTQLSDELQSSLALIRNNEIIGGVDSQSSLNATLRREIADLESRLEEVSAVQPQIAELQNNNLRVQESLEEFRDKIKSIGSSERRNLQLQSKMEEMERNLQNFRATQRDLIANMTVLEARITDVDVPFDTVRETVLQNAEDVARHEILLNGLMQKNETRDENSSLETLKQLSDDLSSSMVSIRELMDSQTSLNATLRHRLAGLESRSARLEEKEASTQGHVATLQDFQLRFQTSLGEIRDKIRAIEKPEGRNLQLQNRIEKLEEDVEKLGETQGDIAANVASLRGRLADVGDQLLNDLRQTTEAVGRLDVLLDGVAYRNETRILKAGLDSLGREQRRELESVRGQIQIIVESRRRQNATVTVKLTAVESRLQLMEGKLTETKDLVSEVASLRNSSLNLENSIDEMRVCCQQNRSSRDRYFLLQAEVGGLKDSLQDMKAAQAKLADVTNVQEGKLWEVEERLENLKEESKANIEVTDHFRELLYGEDGVVYRNETRALDSRLEQVKTQLSDELQSSLALIRDSEISDLVDSQSSLNATLSREIADLESRLKEASAVQPQIAELQNNNVRVQERLEEIRDKIKSIGKSEGRTLQLQNRIEKLEEDVEKLGETQGDLAANVASMRDRLADLWDQLLKDVRQSNEAVGRLEVLLDGVAYRNETRILKTGLDRLGREQRRGLESVRGQIQIIVESQRRQNATVTVKATAIESRLRIIEGKAIAINDLVSDVASLRNSSLNLENTLDEVLVCCQQSRSTRDQYLLLEAEVEGLKDSLEDMKAAQLSTTDLLLKANDQLEDVPVLGENLAALDRRVVRLQDQLETDLEKTLSVCEGSLQNLEAKINGVAYKNDTRILEVGLEKLGRELRKELESGLQSARGREIQVLAEAQRIQNATITEELAASERRLRLLEGKIRATDDLHSEVASLQNRSLHLENSLDGVLVCCEHSKNFIARYVLLQEKSEVLENDLEDLKAVQVSTTDLLLKARDQMEELFPLHEGLKVLNGKMTDFRNKLESDVERTLVVCEDNLQDLATKIDRVASNNDTRKLEKRLEKVEREQRVGVRSSARDLDQDMQLRGVAEFQNALNATLIRKLSEVESRLGVLDGRIADVDSLEEDFLVMWNTSLRQGKQLEDAWRTCECLRGGRTEGTITKRPAVLNTATKPPVILNTSTKRPTTQPPTPEPEPTYLEKVCEEGEEKSQECRTARCLQPLPASEIPARGHNPRLDTLLVRKKGECQTRVVAEAWSIPVKLKAGRECWSLFTASEGEKVDLTVAGKRIPAIEVFDGPDPDSERLPEAHPYSSSDNSILLHMYPDDTALEGTLNFTALTYGEDPLIAIRAICW